MTSLGDIGLNITTDDSPKLEQGQVPGGVSVLCWHATPVANITWKHHAIGSNLVIRSQIGEISDQWRVSLHMVIILFDLVPVPYIALQKTRFQTFIDIFLPEKLIGKSHRPQQKRSLEEQALEYRMSREIKSPKTGKHGILLLRNEKKNAIWKLKSSRLS